MRYLPLFLDVQGQRALVLGSGEVAERKAAALRRAGAVVVFAERFSPDLLDGCVLAIGAEAREADLEALSAAARARALPVNIVDRPALCSYITPAVVDRDPLIVAVGSAGEAPVLARLTRARIEAMLPQAVARLATMAGSLSGELRSRFPSPAARRRVIERMLTGRSADLLYAGDDVAALAEMRREIEGGSATPPGLVSLVNAGPGPADLVTLRAQRVLGEADAILYDDSVSPDVLDLARRDADFIEAQGEDCDALLRLAQAGQRVVRLGAGLAIDALASRLRAAGIAVQFVP